MIVSKTSWHYRLYAAVQHFHFNNPRTQPDLCSYVTTLSVGLLVTGVLLGITAVIWVAIQPFKFIGWVFAGTERRGNITVFAIGGLLCACAFWLVSFLLSMMIAVGVLGMPDNVASFEQLLPSVMLSLAAFIGMIVGFVWLRGKRKAKQVTGTTSFVTLAVTGIKDKWNGTFCRVITLVD